jgi:predicted Rossmann-fold nucleotide-binding protein
MEWLQHSVNEEFVSVENQRQVLISDDPNELLEMILTTKMPSQDTWIDRLNVEFPSA